MKKVLASFVAVLLLPVFFTGSLSVGAYADPGFDYSFATLDGCNMDVMVPDTNEDNGLWGVHTFNPYDFGFSENYSVYFGLSPSLTDGVGVEYRCRDFAYDTKELYRQIRLYIHANYPNVTTSRTSNPVLFDAEIPVFEIAVNYSDKGVTNKAYVFTYDGKGYMIELKRSSDNTTVNQMIARMFRATQF